jgi:hypothetical protein
MTKPQMPITECPECFAAAHTGLCVRRPDNHYYPAPNFAVAGVWPTAPVTEQSLAAARDMCADMFGGADD